MENNPRYNSVAKSLQLNKKHKIYWQPHVLTAKTRRQTIK